MKEEIIKKGKIIFYDNKVDLIFPNDFNTLKKDICEILGLTEDVLSNIRISYLDKDKDNVEMKVDEDYQMFLDEFQKRNEELLIKIEVKEETIINIKKCSSSILDYVKKTSGNINRLSSELKLKDEQFESSEVISDKQNNNDEIKIVEEKLIEEKKINEEKIVEEKSNDKKIENKKDPEKEKIIDDLEKIINEDDGNNKNIVDNIIKRPVQNLFPDLNKQQNQPPKIQNPIQQNILKKEPKIKKGQNFHYLYILSFPFPCSSCQKGPITRYLFYCKDCNLMFCSRCEMIEGKKHPHGFYKVQNLNQYNSLNLNKVSKFNEFIDGVGFKLEGMYNNVLGFFGKNKKKNDNNNNIDLAKKSNTIPQPHWMSLVQIARTTYELSRFTDEQIEEALIQSKGIVDNAIPLLFQ
jgi:hypothetical protein